MATRKQQARETTLAVIAEAAAHPPLAGASDNGYTHFADRSERFGVPPNLFPPRPEPGQPRPITPLPVAGQPHVRPITPPQRGNRRPLD